MNRRGAVIVAILSLCSGCQNPHRQAPILKHIEDLKTNIGKQCSVEGLATDKQKGFLTVVSNDGAEWFVAFSTMASWPQATIGKLVRVTGTAAEFWPKLNANGEPVDDHGRLVAGYTKPIFYLQDCVFHVLE